MGKTFVMCCYVVRGGPSAVHLHIVGLPSITLKAGTGDDGSSDRVSHRTFL